MKLWLEFPSPSLRQGFVVQKIREVILKRQWGDRERVNEQEKPTPEELLTAAGPWYPANLEVETVSSLPVCGFHLGMVMLRDFQGQVKNGHSASTLFVRPFAFGTLSHQGSAMREAWPPWGSHVRKPKLHEEATWRTFAGDP
jgi:hypothetical protein